MRKTHLSAQARYLGLAIVAALLAGLFVYLYLDNLDRRVPVVVASRDFPAYTILDPEDIRTVLLPPVAVHPASLASSDEVLGSVSLVPRAAGEQILSPTLADGRNPGEFRVSLGAGERALFLPSQAVGGGWAAVEEGDFIDLTVVLEETAHCLVQNLEVLAVVRETSESIIGGRTTPPLGLLVRASPEVVERVTLALECGVVYYAINGYAGLPVLCPGAWIYELYGEGERPDESFWP